MTRLLAAAVAVMLAAALVSVAGALGVTRLCPTEDSAGCVWVGPLQGNGHGRIVINPR